MSYFTKEEIRDVEGHDLDIDYVDGGMVIIEPIHHKIHDGHYFSVSDDINLASSGQSGSWLLDTPATGNIAPYSHTNAVHFGFVITSDNSIKVELYAEATCATSGSALAILNQNRADPTTQGCSWYRLPGITASGSRLAVNYIGSAGGGAVKGAGTTIVKDEFVLKSEKKYLIKVTAGTNNCNCALAAEWYISSGSKNVP
jgi:hypothetical protein